MRQIDAELEGSIESTVRSMRKARLHAGLKYNSPHEAILKEGIVFPHEPYTRAEEGLLLDSLQNARALEPKRCFYNAQYIAIYDRRLEYAEGFVMAHGLPNAIAHGWNFIPETGKPVDLTLREIGETSTCDPKDLLARASRNLENAYRGVVIPSDEVRERWFRTKIAGSLLQDPDVLIKIMRRGFPRSWGRTERG